jgi:hypothetical protein
MNPCDPGKTVNLPDEGALETLAADLPGDRAGLEGGSKHILDHAGR